MPVGYLWTVAIVAWCTVFARRRRDVKRVANLRCGDAGKRNLLDVSRHRSHRRAVRR
jgi:hypothetical protein